MFHELGIASHIWNGLEQALQDPTVEPSDRFWALDGLVLSDMKHGRTDRLQGRFTEMERLLGKYQLGNEERLSFIMKRMNFQAEQGDQHAVERSIDAMRVMLPDKPKHHRIFRYNAACALFRLKKLDMAVKLPLEMGVLSFVQNVDKELRNGGKASTCGIHAGI